MLKLLKTPSVRPGEVIRVRQISKKSLEALTKAGFNVMIVSTKGSI